MPYYDPVAIDPPEPDGPDLTELLEQIPDRCPKCGHRTMEGVNLAEHVRFVDRCSSGRVVECQHPDCPDAGTVLARAPCDCPSCRAEARAARRSDRV